MPALKPLDRNLLETVGAVGNYTILGNLPTISGAVLKAKDGEDQARVIKIIGKSSVSYPEDVEDIYREYVFLSRLINHPNVVKMVDMMHSTHRIYFVFETAGERNLSQTLTGMPGQRLPEDSTLHVFDQVLSALAYCHSKNVSHRNVSMEHVAVDSAQRCKLLDFRAAIVSKGNQTSRNPCGRLPCIPPQVALGQNYVPRLADAWSLGVLLLETAGGLNALSQSVSYPPEGANLPLVAQRIVAFFQGRGSHAAALSALGAVLNSGVVTILESLIVLDEGSRTELRDLYKARAPQPEQPREPSES